MWQRGGEVSVTVHDQPGSIPQKENNTKHALGGLRKHLGSRKRRLKRQFWIAVFQKADYGGPNSKSS